MKTRDNLREGIMLGNFLLSSFFFLLVVYAKSGCVVEGEL